MENTKDIEDQLKSLIGLDLGNAGSLPLAQEGNNPPSHGQAPGSYPRGGRGGKARDNNIDNRRGSGGGRDKQHHRGGRRNDSESSRHSQSGVVKERGVSDATIKQVHDEAKLEATYDKQKRAEEFRPSEEVINYLAIKFLFPLKQKNQKFPRAKWFCRLCEYHCDNIGKCLEHVSEPRHSRLTRNRQLEETLRHLPPPNRNHLDCLNSLLASIERDQGLSSSDISSRQAVASVVHNLLQQHLPGSSVRLFGSSWSGFGLKTANINLDLQIPTDHKPHLALLKALDVLNSCQDFHSVTDDFTNKIPAIRFSTHNNLSCELTLNNYNAFQTSSLLRDYWNLDSRVRTLGVAFRYWASLVKLDRQAEGSLPPHSFAILLVYFLQQQSEPVLPCIHDYLDTAHNESDSYNSPYDSLKNWRTNNQKTVAELWIELFSFYSIGFQSAELVISIKRREVLTKEEKQWSSKKLAIEDPFSSRRNLCRSIQSLSVYDYITDYLRTGFLYFGCIQTSSGPVITRIIPRESRECVGGDTDIRVSDWTLESWLAAKGTVVTEQEATTAAILVPRNMLSFRFDQGILTNGHVLALQCVACGHEGHLASSCPEEQLPELPPLPTIPPGYLKMLSAVCEEVANDWKPSPQELRDRDKILRDLTGYIKKSWPNAELTLFGSSSNGFAFRQSDLDISMTFQSIKDATDLDSISIIEEVGEKVKKMAGVKNVLAITSAKVPIVKLYHTQARIDADISLYNTLASENTKLLQLYSELDPRCKTLGYMVKLFAKVCDIGDASRGSLSSYAYILMMIFWLQKVSPPVLPVLQELYQGPNQPENIVDGWNAWFCSDRKIIQSWPGWNKNRWNVGDLWIGFLDFFARSWDDKRLVVSIRQSRHLTKFEKMWISPCIAIEDPFELSHNLGAGISRKMNLYIKKAFINARDLFGTPIRFKPPNYHTIQDYFFDRNLLTDGAPPNDRGCRACGKIGHLVADCPRKKASDDRKRADRERREKERQDRQETREAQKPTKEKAPKMTEQEPPRAARDQRQDTEKIEQGQLDNVVFASSDIRTRQLNKKIAKKEKLKEKRKALKVQAKEAKTKTAVSTSTKFTDPSVSNSVDDSVEVITVGSKPNKMFEENIDEEFNYTTVEKTVVEDGKVLDYMSFDGL